MTKENLCFAVVFLAEALIAGQYLENIFLLRRKRNIEILSFTVGYIFLFWISCFDSWMLNAIFFFATNSALAYGCFNCSLKTALFHSGLLNFIVTVTEVIVAFGLSFFTKDFAAYSYDFSVMVSLSVLSKLLYYSAVILSKKICKRQNRERVEPKVLWLLSTFPGISTMVVVAIIYAGMTSTLSMVTQVLLVLSSISLLFVNSLMLIIYNHIQKVNQENMKMQLTLHREKADAAYYEMLQKQYGNQRVLIHDIRSHLALLRNLVETERFDQVADYLKQLDQLPALQNKVLLCGNRVLNMVLQQHKEQCGEKGVAFHCDVRDKSVDFMKETDLTALFGNLLSNALEAAEQVQGGEVELSVTWQPLSRQTVIVVVNSCEDPPLLHPQGGYRTRKKDKLWHGVGLKSIDQVVKRYQGDCQRTFDTQKGEFQCVILLPNEKEEENPPGDGGR